MQLGLKGVVYEKQLNKTTLRVVTQEYNFILAYTLTVKKDKITNITDVKLYGGDARSKAIEEAVKYEAP